MSKALTGIYVKRPIEISLTIIKFQGRDIRTKKTLRHRFLGIIDIKNGVSTLRFFLAKYLDM